MHANDFRSDLAPTRSQYRRIAEGLLSLAGERAPADRQAATELILRIEAEPGADPESAAAAHELASVDPILKEPARDLTAHRLGGRRATARPGGVA